MSADQAIVQRRPVTATSLSRKLLDVFVTPGDVLEEIATTPPNVANWLAPTMLVCIVAIAWPSVFGSSSAGAGLLTGALGPILGTIWSAFVFWIIGRVFLRSKFSFLKSLEVVGVSAMILVLGSIVTGLLVLVSGRDAARPALSLLLLKSYPAGHLFAALGVLDVFNLWTTVVLAIGLSRLSGVSFREAAFWTFGYWIVLRVALILLA